jgi:UDP-glucose 6-dehydrogenase
VKYEGHWAIFEVAMKTFMKDENIAYCIHHKIRLFPAFGYGGYIMPKDFFSYFCTYNLHLTSAIMKINKNNFN